MPDPSPLDGVAWPVRTQRLRIRPATPDDLDATWQFRRLPEVHEWLSRATTERAEYAEHFLGEQRLALTLVMELDGVVVGDLMLRVGDGWSQHEVAEQAWATEAELGWAVDPAYAGRGLATEAAGELLRIAFEDLGLRRVTAQCFADNLASWRIMEKLGMRREVSTRAESLHRTRGWLDGLGYAILAEEWREQRRREPTQVT